MTQIRKGQRVEVRHEAGTELGTVTGVYGPDHPQVDVHLDDDTHCWFPTRQVHPVNEQSHKEN